MSKYTIINLGRWFLNRRYDRYKKKPIKKKIIFLSRQADVPSIDFEMLEEESHRQHPDYETVMLCHFMKPGFKNKLSDLRFLFTQMKQLATAQAAILDSYSIPVSLLDHRPELFVLQIWHSVGTMKKFGYSILDQAEGRSSELAHAMRMHQGYSYVLAAGEGYKDHLAEGFHFDRGRILTFPLPRLEPLQDPNYIQTTVNRIYNTYPKMQHKKNIVYVPTFRKDEDDAFRDALKALADQIDFSAYNLIVKAHPIVTFDTDDSRLI